MEDQKFEPTTDFEINKEFVNNLSEEELQNLEMLNLKGGLRATLPSYGCPPRPTTGDIF